MPTTSVRYTQAIPCLSYDDARKAITWLVDVLGADAKEVHGGPDDSVAHAELWFGEACIMLGSMKSGEMASKGFPPTATGQSVVYVVVPKAEDVDALHARAVVGGAKIVISLRDTDYGSHDFGCLDPEGNFWGFGTYAPTR
jgi:uncharacterized glyoxalase superfamily protein PhnB